MATKQVKPEGQARTRSESRSDELKSDNPRRAQLLDAATRVLADSGLRGLTHRAVDREAGFAEGTCSVSFRTRAALLQGLTAHVGSRLAAEVKALSDIMPVTSDDPLLSLPYTTELLERWATEDGGALVIAILELSLESLRSPELVEPINEWRNELLAIVESLICRSSKPDPAPRAVTTVASMQGIMLSALAVEPAKRGSYIAQTVAMVLVGTASEEPLPGVQRSVPSS